jgi:hypothetical protein
MADAIVDTGLDAAGADLERRRERECRFHEALGALEERFAAPPDGCAPADWIGPGSTAFERLRPLLLETRAEHRAALAQIAAEDLGLQPRIDEMEAAEQILGEREGELADRFAALSQRLASGDEDAAVWEAELTRFAEEGLDWVSRVRAQDLAVRTWLTEALTRDRGVVD